MDARHDEKQRDKKGQGEGSILAGIGFTVAAILLYGVQDASAKILLRDIPVPMIVMLRFWAFGLLALFLGMKRFGFSLQAVARAFVSSHVHIQLLRALVLLGDLLLFATGLRTLPLGVATAITLTFPLMVTLLAIPILGEKVGLFRWLSILVGFAGAMLIVRPGFGVFNIGILWVLAGTGMYALYLVLTRLVSGADGTQTNMLYAGVIGMVASSLVGVFFWHTPDLSALGVILLLMGATSGANYCVVRALAAAPASVIQPFNYLLLPWAIFLNFTVFGTVIDGVSLIGAMLIVGAGLAVWLRERNRESTRPAS